MSVRCPKCGELLHACIEDDDDAEGTLIMGHLPCECEKAKPKQYCVQCEAPVAPGVSYCLRCLAELEAH